MKKIFAAGLIALGFTVSVFASDPILYGENIFELSSPEALTNVPSVAGGGINTVGSASLVVNPALAAKEQRVELNFGATELIKTGSSKGFGMAIQGGILIPFKWAVFSGYTNGLFADNVLSTGNSFNIKASLSKEVTDQLSVGAGLNTGYSWSKGGDWALSANLGFVYNWGRLAFMDDFRIGASIQNLGKNYQISTESGFFDSYPSFSTIRAGASAIFVQNDDIKLGGSFDITTPCFKNALFDAGINFGIKDIVYINIAEKMNLKDMIAGHPSLIPTIGVSFKFNFNVSNNSYLERNDWSESEMRVGAAYKNLYGNIHAVSEGVDLYLGMKDSTPPVIELWMGEDDD